MNPTASAATRARAERRPIPTLIEDTYPAGSPSDVVCLDLHFALDRPAAPSR